MRYPAGHDLAIPPYIVRLIKEWEATHAYSPTVRELATVYGCNVSTMHSHLERCKALGLVTWEQGKNRTLRLAA